MHKVLIAHGRRELVHVNVTANPTAAWLWRQVMEATPWGQKPRHVLQITMRSMVATSADAPDALASTLSPRRSARRANAVVERVIGTLRRECLDHLIILDEQHLRSVLSEFVRYYNEDRPHRTLGLEAPGEPVPGLPEVVQPLYWYMETYDSPLEMEETARTFGVHQTTLEEYVRRTFTGVPT